jgi:hypothetical protein
MIVRAMNKQPASDECHALDVCPRTNPQLQNTAAAQGPEQAESWGPEGCLAISLEEGLSANLLAPRKVGALKAWAQISGAHCSVEVVQVDEPLVAEQEHPIAGFDGPAV